MRFPIGFTMAQARHRRRMERAGHTRYPTVLMLEPLYTCNLACIGCSVERHTGKLKDRMSLETCFKAVEDSGAPIVNICGGEPTLYPELKELVEGLIERGKYILMCTNAIKLAEKVFDNAVEMIKQARARGYYTFINTTVFKETPVSEVEEMCRMVDELKANGIL